MKKYLLAGAALAVLASPAAARDRSAYFGIEVGAMALRDARVTSDFFDNDTDFFEIDHKLGVDGDLIAGYDFGFVRAEWEGGYKNAKHDEYSDGVSSVPAEGHSRAWSIMGNVLADLGRDESFNFYVGGGAGIAWIRQSINLGDDDDDEEDFSLNDSRFAWQLIAGVRAPVWTHFDVGLKYRYFNGGKIREDFGTEVIRSRFRSHSLLLSLIYNFNGPPAPPPPPPVTPERGL